MSTFLTVALLSVLTSVGLVGAVVTDGTASLIWGLATVAGVAALAWRLRSAQPGAGAIAAFTTAMVILCAGMPAALVLTDVGGPSVRSITDSDEKPIDLSAELKAILAKAEEIQPGSTNSLIKVTIRQSWTQLSFLDLSKGQEVWFQRSRSGSSDSWSEPTRRSTNDRADVAFSAADIRGLDLTAASAKVDGAVRTLDVEHEPSSSDEVEIGRRSGDRLLVATYDHSPVEIEVDPKGNIPDNLALARVDGLLPTAERLLRENGFTPDQAVIDDLDYRVFATNVGSVGSGRGTLEIRVRGAGRNGTLKETVGKFPEVDLSPNTYTPDDAFALRTVTAAAIERARADAERRFSVIPIDAHALGLSVDADTRSSGRAPRQTVMQIGLGPGSDNAAYYRMDGTFLRSGS